MSLGSNLDSFLCIDLTAFFIVRLFFLVKNTKSTPPILLCQCCSLATKPNMILLIRDLAWEKQTEKLMERLLGIIFLTVIEPKNA